MQHRWQSDPLPDYLRARPRLFGIAYRILRSAAEAEEIVQDVWVRWQATDRRVVVEPPAFLATAATRLAINAAHSARSRRETQIEPRLPEPVDTGSDPCLEAVRGEALESAVLILLRKLTPRERAAYVLREAFDYRYRQIAALLQLKEANARQLVTRARQHIAAGRRTPVRAEEQRRLFAVFLGAARQGDLASLEGAFAWDAVSPSDSRKPGAKSVAAIDASELGIRCLLRAMRSGGLAALPKRNKPRAA